MVKSYVRKVKPYGKDPPDENRVPLLLESIPQ